MHYPMPEKQLIAGGLEKQTKAQNIMKPTELPFFLLLVSLGLDSKAAQTQNCAPGTDRKSSKRRPPFLAQEAGKGAPKVKGSRGNPLIFCLFLFCPLLPYLQGNQAAVAMTTPARKENLFSDLRNCDPRCIEGTSTALFSLPSLLLFGSQGKGSHRACKAEQRNSSLSFLARGAGRRILWIQKVWENNRKKRELSEAVCELQESSPSCT